MTQQAYTGQEWPRDEKGNVLFGALVGREWRQQRNGRFPREWESGLWSLDHAVQEAIKGGWTDEEIATEVRQLTESYRGRVEAGDDDA